MSDENAIAAQREAWMDAFFAEDIPRMSHFVTEDTLVMPPNQPQRVGLEAAQEFWQEGFAAAETVMETHSHDVRVAGDLAIDRFNWKQRITLRETEDTVEDEGICIWIWRRGEDGTWRVAGAIWNSDLAQPGVWSGG